MEGLRRYRSEGVLTVEMEASALFAVGEYRRVGVSSIVTISDKLTDSGWNPRYHHTEKEESLRKIFDAAMDAIPSFDTEENDL